MTAPKFSNKEKAQCAEREMRQRQRVYARLVGDGKMSQQKADRESALMEEIWQEYEIKAQQDEMEERLL